ALVIPSASMDRARAPAGRHGCDHHVLDHARCRRCELRAKARSVSNDGYSQKLLMPGRRSSGEENPPPRENHLVLLSLWWLGVNLMTSALSLGHSCISRTSQSACSSSSEIPWIRICRSSLAMDNNCRASDNPQARSTSICSVNEATMPSRRLAVSLFIVSLPTPSTFEPISCMAPRCGERPQLVLVLAKSSTRKRQPIVQGGPTSAPSEAAGTTPPRTKGHP